MRSKRVNARQEPASGPWRVLVVDDNWDAANSMSTLLSMGGYHSTVAYDGRAAQHALNDDIYDVVLLDLGLPDMSGHDVCKHVRTNTMRQPLIIALTGWGQEQDISATADAGFDAHLVKPVDSRTLQSTLATLLAAKGARPNER